MRFLIILFYKGESRMEKLSNLTPSNSIYRKVNQWNHSNSILKKQICSRTVSLFIGTSADAISVIFNAICFIAITPAIGVRYTIGLIPFKIKNKWKPIGSFLPDNLGFKNWINHAYKIVAFSIGIFSSFIIGTIYPKANIWVHVKLGLIRLPKETALPDKLVKLPGKSKLEEPLTQVVTKKNTNKNEDSNILKKVGIADSVLKLPCKSKWEEPLTQVVPNKKLSQKNPRDNKNIKETINGSNIKLDNSETNGNGNSQDILINGNSDSKHSRIKSEIEKAVKKHAKKSNSAEVLDAANKIDQERTTKKNEFKNGSPEEKIQCIENEITQLNSLIEKTKSKSKTKELQQDVNILKKKLVLEQINIGTNLNPVKLEPIDETHKIKVGQALSELEASQKKKKNSYNVR